MEERFAKNLYFEIFEQSSQNNSSRQDILIYIPFSKIKDPKVFVKRKITGEGSQKIAIIATSYKRFVKL